MKISYIYLRIYKVLQIKKYIKETIFKKKRERKEISDSINRFRI